MIGLNLAGGRGTKIDVGGTTIADIPVPPKNPISSRQPALTVVGAAENRKRSGNAAKEGRAPVEAG